MGLTFDRSRPGFWLSSAAHVGLLAAALIAFTDKLPEAEEGIPVEVITDNQFSQITRGERSAQEVQAQPKPRAERLAEKVEERDPGEAKQDMPAPPQRPAEMKVAEREVEAAAPPPPPLRPALDQPEPTPPPRPARAEAAETAPEPPKRPVAQAEPPKAEELAKLTEREDAELQAAQAKRQADAKAKADADSRAKAVAEAKAKADAESKAKAESDAKAVADAKAKAESDAKAMAAAKAKAESDVKARAEADAKAKALAQAKAKAEAEAKAKKQAELANKFSAGDIRQLLASKEPSQSSGSTGREINRTASLGTATGNAQKLNPSMRDALAGLLQSQIERCYMAPPGAAGAKATVPVLNVQFNADGTLLTEPKIVRSGSSALDRSVAEAALRAVRRCAPYKIPAQFAPFYNDWKNTIAQFELPQV